MVTLKVGSGDYCRMLLNVVDSVDGLLYDLATEVLHKRNFGR